jgi:hypothetical protein
MRLMSVSSRSDFIPANFTGTWHADLEASRMLGPTPASIVAVIVHEPPDLRIDMRISTTDGREVNVSFNARTTDVVSNTVLGGEWVSRSRWVGRELLIESDVSQPGRTTHLCDYWSMSDDGSELIMEHRGDDLAGQVTVLRRTAAIGGAIDAEPIRS